MYREMTNSTVHMSSYILLRFYQSHSNNPRSVSSSLPNLANRVYNNLADNTRELTLAAHGMWFSTENHSLLRALQETSVSIHYQAATE